MDIFEIASIIGSLAFGLSGFFLGVRKNLDIMGLFIVAMLTANGGGVVRDILVGQTPTILVDSSGFIIILLLVMACFILRINQFDALERKKFFVLSDSIGLVAFSITGSLVALNNDLNIFGVMLLAFITATGGGIIRDVFVNEVPAVLSSGFYGSVAIIIGIALFLFNKFEILNDIVIAATFIVGLAIRILAHFNDWHLPKVRSGR